MINRNCTVGYLVLLFGLSPLISTAAEPVKIERTIPYQNASVGSVAIRQECTWNTALSQSIAKQAKGNVVVSDVLPALEKGKVLRMSVVNVHAIGGPTGPRWAVVRGELTENGELVGNFEFRRTTTRGFKACSVLDRISEALAEDISAWLNHPSIDPNVSKIVEANTSDKQQNLDGSDQ